MQTDLFYYLRFLIPALLIIPGLLVIIRRKPIIFSYWWFLAFFILIFIEPAAGSFIIYETSHSTSILSLVVFIVVIVYWSFAIRGCNILGASAEDFQKNFSEVMTDLNLQYEHTLTLVRIIDPELEFFINFQSWLGNGQLRLKGRANKELFYRIIKELRSRNIRAHYLIPISFTLFGILIIFLMW